MSFKTPSQIADDYLVELKSLKRDLNTSQTDNDWYIRSRVVGGMAAGLYADQRSIANDAFPDRAREDAVLRFLDLYFAGGYIPATPSVGNVAVTGDPSTVLPQGLQFTYSPNGNTYQSTVAVILPAATAGSVTALVPVQSVVAGQNQNLSASAPLVVASPPGGLNPAAMVDAEGLADARNQETVEQARARIVTRIRQPLGVGRISDYIQYAEAADPSVVSASVVRYPFGLGTVAVYITSGTTDIDAAIDAGQPISVIPSDELVAIVQAYLNVNRPVTDCVTVLKPVAVSVDVTVEVSYQSGTGSTILNGQTLTQSQLVAREVQRAIYKTPVGGRVIGASGFVVASDIEETIDAKLSIGPVTVGSIPILADRQVHMLSVTGFNRALLPNEVPIPGTIVILG